MNLRYKLFDHLKNEPFRIPHDQESADHQIALKITSMLPHTANQPIVIFCIGTDRSTGDCLGPLIGTKITEKDCPTFMYMAHWTNLFMQLIFKRKLRKSK